MSLLQDVREFFERQIEEISSSPALRCYGALLGCADLVTFRWFRRYFPLAAVLSDRLDPVCWPLAPDCGRFHFASLASAQAFVWLFGATALAVPLCFAAGRARRGYWALTAAEALKLAAMAIDYRSFMNQHYLSLFVAVVFLLAPRKAETVKFLLVLVYVWTGILKCNGDWLSGSLVVQWWSLLPALLPVWCGLAVLLECGASWLLLSPRPALFWGALSAFAAFHAASWHVVGSYYPLVMACLLPIFPLTRLFDGPDAAPLAARFKRLPPASAAWLLLFCVLQAAPYLYPYDSALRGGGRRLYSLWLFSPMAECRMRVDVRLKDGTSREMPLVPYRFMATRLQCQPFIAWNMARNRCARLRSDPSFADLDLKMDARRFGHADPWTTLVDVPRFCAETPPYRILGANDWIKRQD